MKIYLLMFLAFFLPSCDYKAVDISKTTVLWEGDLNQNPTLLKRFKDASSCVNSFGYQRSGYPHVIIVKDPFICGSKTNALGCAVFSTNTIYIAADNEYFKNRTKPGKQLITVTDPVKHESIHWITRKDNDTHNQPYFKQCETTDVPLPESSGNGLVSIVTASVISR